MKFQVVTLFPNLIENQLREGVVGQAVAAQRVQIEIVNPRQYTQDIHKTVDDRPYGGGDGMVMLYEPLAQAIQSFGQPGHVVYLSAHGRQWSDSRARELTLSTEPITLVCGRYAGVDQRFINDWVDEEISIGDYVLSGGELAASVVIDSVVRLMPDVLGNEKSNQEDSFAHGLLEAPQFTRPQMMNQQVVPKVFLSGDHKKITQARAMLALLVTMKRRPDLIQPQHRRELIQYKKWLNDFSQDEWLSCGLEKNEVENYFYEFTKNT